MDRVRRTTYVELVGRSENTYWVQWNHNIIYMYLNFAFSRGNLSIDGAGLGQEKPADLKAEDDEFDAFRKRMMLAYRFRPNPLVRGNNSIKKWYLTNWVINNR